MEDGISLNEQMKDLDFYKMIQKERSIISKHTIDEYRMDIAKRLIDESIKKQAIEVVNLIESQLEENQKLEDEEDEYDGEVEYVSIDDYVESVENESNLGEMEQGEVNACPLQSNNPFEEPKVYEMPEYQMTEEEQAAMDEMAEFNKDNSLFKDLESTNNNQTRASFKESNHLNTAKQSIKALKKDIDSKVKEIDVEKLDEQMQTFGVVILGVLNGIRSFLGKTAVALYKIPAKRAQKKNLDYSLKEANGAFKGKSIDELGEEGIKMFKLEWGPKLVLLLSAILIYNNFWKMGSITLAIGLIYYLVTYFSYDYGGSKMLNILANYMDSQGIRMKDAYYTNMIVLYRYFNEYQSDMNVSIDESGPIEIAEDPELGSILKFYVNEDKNTVISSITDHRLNYFKVVPFLDQYNLKAKLQEKRQVAVMLDQILLMAIKKDDDIAELYSQKEEYWDYFAELKGLAEQKAALENARLQQIEDEKFFEDMKKKKLSERAINIIKYLKRDKNTLSMSPHDLNGIGISGNDDYLRVRMSLNGGLTETQAKSKLDYIGSKTGLTPKIKPTGTSSAVNLMFYLNPILKGRAMTIDEIKSDAEQGFINLGKGILGDYKVSMPRGDEPFFLLTGAITRAGKSTIVSRILTSAAYLVDDNGFHDYQDFFIASAKPADYMSNGFQARGMFVSNEDPVQAYQMLKFVDEFAQKRQQIFIDSSVVNIKQYNKKFPNNKLGKIMVVVDEYANILALAGKKKIETEDGKVSLEDAIVQLLIKINSLHGAAGVSATVITQSFAKNSVGRVRDSLGSHLLGYADKDVWNSIDSSHEMSNYMKTRKESFKGLFFLKSTDFRPIKGVEYESFDSGYVEIATHFIDTDDIEANFDRNYETAAKYTNLILNSEALTEEVEEEEETINNLDVEETVETTEEEFIF